MTRDEILDIVHKIIDRQSRHLTVIWLCPGWVEILDPRGPLERLEVHFMIESVYINAHHALEPGDIRIMFAFTGGELSEFIADD